VRGRYYYVGIRYIVMIYYVEQIIRQLERNISIRPWLESTVIYTRVSKAVASCIVVTLFFQMSKSMLHAVFLHSQMNQHWTSFMCLILSLALTWNMKWMQVWRLVTFTFSREIVVWLYCSGYDNGCKNCDCQRKRMLSWEWIWRYRFLPLKALFYSSLGWIMWQNNSSAEDFRKKELKKCKSL